jgi:hypothetical protein
MARIALMRENRDARDGRPALVILSPEFCAMCDAFGIPDDNRRALYYYLDIYCRYPDGVPPHWRDPNFIECMAQASCASRAYAWHIRREHGPGLYNIPWVPLPFKLKIGRLGQCHYLVRRYGRVTYQQMTYKNWQILARSACSAMRDRFDRAMLSPHKAHYRLGEND